MNAAVALDTLALAKELKAAGFNDQQAEAVTRVFSQTRDAFDLVTKADLREVELRLDAKITITVEAAKAELIKWMFGVIGLQTIVIVAALVAVTRAVR